MLNEIESDKKSINSSSKSSNGNSINIYKINSEKYRNQLKFTKKKRDEFAQSQTKNLEKKDLLNRENSKLSSLIRKKYTILLKESIKHEESKEKFVFTKFFHQITKKVYIKMAGTIFQSVISLVAAILYIISTYYPEESETNDKRKLRDINNIKWAELVVGLIITLDYIVCFILSRNKLKFVFNFLNILDLITLVPTFLNIFKITNKSLGFVRIFRIIRIMRIFRLHKILNQSKGKEKDDGRNEASRRLITSLLWILAVVLLGSGIIHFLNDTFPEQFSLKVSGLDVDECKSGNDFAVNEIVPFYEGINMSLSCPEGDQYIYRSGNVTFDIALYYMVITMATVGYGDIYAQTSLMRLVVSVLIIISIISISQLEVNDFLKLNSQYISEFKERKGNKHIILSGFFTKSSLHKFLTEFYHEDHKEKSANIKIVIIQDEFPNKEIQSILLNPKFDENLHYIKGDIFSEKTLSHAKVETANAIILKSDQTMNGDADKNDQYLILATKALSQITQAPIFVQFNSTQSLLHDWADWDLACSSQQIKMSIIIKNGFISGFSTMIMNLTSSISSNIYSKGFGNTPWILEYMEGASQELYIVQPPENFEEIEFTKFVEKSYLNHGSIPFGIRKKIVSPEDKEIVYFNYILNPVGYTITKNDQIIVISGDEDEAKQIFKDSKKYKKKHSHVETDAKLNIQNTERETKNNYATSENKSLIEENLEYLKENFRDENIIENTRNNHNYDGHSKTNSESDDDSAIEKQIPKEFIKKKKKFKIWEADHQMLSYLENHYLVFCREDQLSEFLASFNSYFKTIVYFVTDQHPGNKWEIIKTSYKNVICIESSYSDQEHLNKLHLNKCKHAYILTYAVEKSSVSDSGILPLVKLIEENYEKCKYTLELADELNVRYLSSKGVEDENIDEELKNPGVLTTMNFNYTGNNLDKTKKAAKLPVRLWPKYAKSDIFFSSSLDSLMAFSYHNQGSLDIILKLLGIQTGESPSDIQTNSEISIYRYIGRSDMRTEYETIVRYFLMLTPPVIPIAVYRYADNNNYLKNEMPYIITNPKKDLELNQYDQVICIGRASPDFFEKLLFFDLLNDSQSDHMSSSSDSSFNLGRKNQNDFSVPENKREELENLTEEQLLERLKNEINYFHLDFQKLTVGGGLKVSTKNLSRMGKIEENNEETLFDKDKVIEENVENETGSEKRHSSRMIFNEIKLNKDEKREKGKNRKQKGSSTSILNFGERSSSFPSESDSEEEEKEDKKEKIIKQSLFKKSRNNTKKKEGEEDKDSSLVYEHSIEKNNYIGTVGTISKLIDNNILSTKDEEQKKTRISTDAIVSKFSNLKMSNGDKLHLSSSFLLIQPSNDNVEKNYVKNNSLSNEVIKLEQKLIDDIFENAEKEIKKKEILIEKNKETENIDVKKEEKKTQNQENIEDKKSININKKEKATINQSSINKIENIKDGNSDIEIHNGLIAQKKTLIDTKNKNIEKIVKTNKSNQQNEQNYYKKIENSKIQKETENNQIIPVNENREREESEANLIISDTKESKKVNEKTNTDLSKLLGFNNSNNIAKYSKSETTHHKGKPKIKAKKKKDLELIKLYSKSNK